MGLGLKHICLENIIQCTVGGQTDCHKGFRHPRIRHNLNVINSVSIPGGRRVRHERRLVLGEAAMAGVGNAPHKLLCLNPWSSVLGDCKTSGV